jgi:sugar O-acyltransferase (sialic acid O-acetyltransferase NeuD family)
LKKVLVLIGGGGHCRSCIDVIEQAGEFRVIGIVDMKNKIGESILGYPILASDDQLTELAEKHRNFLITIGQIKSSEPRIRLFNQIKNMNPIFPIVISPRSYVSRHASLGEGTIVMHGVTINAGAVIGRNCIINTGAIIEHDAEIGDHCHVSTGAIVNGGAKIGSGSFFGSGSVAKENVLLSSNCFVKAHSLVKNDR